MGNSKNVANPANPQLDTEGNLIEAIVSVSKETLKKFAVKRLIETRNGIEIWGVSLTPREQALKIPPPTPRRRGGGKPYPAE